MQTADFPLLSYLDLTPYFPTFNPVQEAAIQYLQSDHNLVLSAPTGSGKTEVAEMYVAQALSQQKKALYLIPFKSLGEEKFFGRWSTEKHSFYKQPKMLMTGDYQMTDKRKQYLQGATIIAATSEMLDHRTRHITSQHSQWIKQVGALIVDEAHLLTDGSKNGDGRGHKLECAIMRFVECNPTARIILLSATMPNVQDLASWLTKITGRPTDLFQSTYRPCKLNRHFVKYFDGGNSFSRRAVQMQECVNIVRRYPQDQFLIFTASKKWGRAFVKQLQDLGQDVDFHNADKRRVELNAIETKFRARQLRILVSTQTLSAGVNLPARRVIIPHVTYGLNQEVPVYEIQQEEGRSGRLGLDPEGDSYILVPESDAKYHELRIQQGEKITSQLLNEFALTFHLIGEIAYGSIKTLADAEVWYQKSLAYQQSGKFPVAPTFEQVINLLKQHDLVYWKQGEIVLSPLGKVCAMFYLPPLDVSAWARNFDQLFHHCPDVSQWNRRMDCLASFCLSAIPSCVGVFPNIDDIIPPDDDEEYLSMSDYVGQLNQVWRGAIPDMAAKVGYVTYCLMNGIPTGDYNYSIVKGLENDHERIIQAISTIDQMVTKWDQKAFFTTLNLRLNYKVPARFVPLVQLEGIAKGRALKLWHAGLKTPKDLLANPDLTKKTLGAKLGANTLAFAYENVYNRKPMEQGTLEGIHG